MCCAALTEAREAADGWQPWQDLVSLASHCGANGAASSSSTFQWSAAATRQDSLMLQIAEECRAQGLWGQGAQMFGGPDELLFISGGPCSDVCRFSMLAGVRPSLTWETRALCIPVVKRELLTWIHSFFLLRAFVTGPGPLTQYCIRWLLAPPLKGGWGVTCPFFFLGAGCCLFNLPLQLR